ncbi:hypothetical protein MTO96_043470 [Rhipicephalus appendiculatus]
MMATCGERAASPGHRRHTSRLFGAKQPRRADSADAEAPSDANGRHETETMNAHASRESPASVFLWRRLRGVPRVFGCEMDPTGSAAAAVPAHDTADALGDLLLHLEDVRGCFSGSLIDYRTPCTASEDTMCQIVASIPLWNEFLCWLELELRELPGEGRQLGLVQVRNVCHMRPTQSQMRQAATLLYWLLNTHRCVASVQIPNNTVDPEMASLCGVVLCSVLQISCPDATFPNTVSALLLASATLTVLDFNAPLVATTPNRLLLNALKVNSVLRDLTLSYTAIIEDPGSFLDFLSSTVVLKRLKVVGCPYGNSRDAMKWIFQGMLKNKTVSTLEAHELRFLRYLHSDISENYALCSVDVDLEFVCLPWQAHWLTVVRDTARRNSGYVTRAAQFLNGRRCDTPCAAALDRVYRHPALAAELSKVLSISEAEAVVAVRQRFRSIEGLHEFMRLAGVVKARVMCQPRDDGLAQLDALDQHCWDSRETLPAARRRGVAQPVVYECDVAAFDCQTVKVWKTHQMRSLLGTLK